MVAAESKKKNECIEDRRTASAREIAEAKLNRTVVAQLSKTKMCAMFARGACYEYECRFAHSSMELRAPPDLTKTAICRAFARGECNDANCRFAHGEHELRVTPDVYKTQLCNFFERGYCKKGDRCRHAHGHGELRNAQGALARPSAPPAAEAPTAAARTLAAKQHAVAAAADTQAAQAQAAWAAQLWPAAPWQFYSGFETPEKTAEVPAIANLQQWGCFPPEPMKVPLPHVDQNGIVERDQGLWGHDRDFGAIVDSIRTEFMGEDLASPLVAGGDGGFVTPPRERGLLRYLDAPSSPWHPASDGRDKAAVAA